MSMCCSVLFWEFKRILEKASDSHLAGAGFLMLCLFSQLVENLGSVSEAARSLKPGNCLATVASHWVGARRSGRMLSG